jgi:Amt family ammonium transporter
MPAIVIGGVAGLLCFAAVRMKQRFHYDDALDVVGVHAAGGIWGALATGLFASAMVNSAGANGLLFGNPRLLMIQAIAVVATIAFSFIGSTILLKVTDAMVGIRVSDEDQEMGLDLREHEERGYAFEG